MSGITVENFFVKSTGTFKEVEKLPDGLILNFQSKSSTYYVNQEGTQLWRISDHWGYKIRECDWYLEGYAVVKSSQWKKLYGREMKIGTIEFARLSHNFNKRGKRIKNAKKRHRKRQAIATIDTREVRTVSPAPTMMPCVFSDNGHCRTQLIAGVRSQCGIRRDSFAHQVCNRMNAENQEVKQESEFLKEKRLKLRELKPEFMTTEEDDYNSRK